MFKIDERVADTCIARHTCKQHGKMCSTACPWHIDLRYQMDLSGIPKRYQKWAAETLPEDTYALKLLRHYAATDADRANGNGLFLWGGTGTGKTTVACALGNSYIINRTRLALQRGELLGQLVAYANVPELLELIKRGFDDEEAAVESRGMMHSLRTANRVILDDIGAEKPTDWVRERLLTIINERHDNELVTHFTSNLTLDQVEITLGKRIRSRIEGMTVQVEVRGADRRRKA